MPHVHPKGIDLVVSMFVVSTFDKPSVLLVDHKKLGCWLAPGGHVGDHDPYQTVDQAIAAELLEETGAVLGKDVTPIRWTAPLRLTDAERLKSHNQQSMLTPWRVDLHDVPQLPGHKHLALVYLMWATRRFEPVLEASAHNAIKWCTIEDIRQMTLLPAIRSHCLDAIQEVLFGNNHVH